LFRHRVTQFEQEVVTIHPGEYFATSDDTIISTVLGSCIAVALFDPARKMGGLNHFMLPGEVTRDDIIRSPNAKYGMYAIELLVNELMKLGIRKKDIRAKVFGGGAVLRFADGGMTKIPQSNIDFTFEYLEKESIPILASDVGGREPRKIFMFPTTGKVLLKRIAPSQVDLVEKEEERYLDVIKEEAKEDGEVTLFVQNPSRSR
jgi:chemotaxis protein CheD